MNLVQLRHLLALTDSGSFSRAAVRSHLSQPALSRSIRSLEDELGLRLIDRIGKRNELSIAGRMVVERARRIVSDADELRQIAGQLEAGLTGAVGIGLGAGPGAVLAVPLLARFGSDHPDVQVRVARGETGLLVQSLRDRTLDVLVVDLRSVRPAPDLAIDRLPDMRAGFFVRPGHPLAKRRDVSFAALAEWPIASTPLADDVAHMLVEDFGPGGHPSVLVRRTCNDIETLIRAVLESDAVFLGIEAATRVGSGEGKLVRVRMKVPFRRSARFAIVTLAGRAELPVMPLLRNFIRERMRD